MALVGPRPRVPDDHSFDAALAGIKPGLTSWTSVAHVGLLERLSRPSWNFAAAVRGVIS
jgi:lipopolysaccharide/colanic/teichoic acid biosynthesis glycosyltransferase